MRKYLPSIYEFDRFRLEVQQRVLVKDGAPLTLAPKVLDTLIALVQNHGQILDKVDLINVLWPESFVVEANLSQNIFVLRELLGDNRRNRIFIQTIHRRGYRFVAKVKESELRTSARDDAYVSDQPASSQRPSNNQKPLQPDADRPFADRDAESRDLAARVEISSLLAIIGNAGAGKSSLVHAGLIPTLRDGQLGQAGAARSWCIATFRPSPAPFDYLAEVLPGQLAPHLSLGQQAEFIADCRNRLPMGGDSLRNAVSVLASARPENPGKTHFLLVADQFEEIFALGVPADVRNQYIDALLAAARLDCAVPVHVVLVLRADFYGHCLHHSQLSHRLEANIYNVPSIAGWCEKPSVLAPEPLDRIAGTFPLSLESEKSRCS